ncbi:MAG: arginase family protein [Bacteroidia bacterium]
MSLTLPKGEELYETLPTWDKAQIVILPIPYEGAVSFRKGTAHAPKRIQSVSHQLDTYLFEHPGFSPEKIFLMEIPPPFERGEMSVDTFYTLTLKPYVGSKAEEILMAGKLPFVLGGDHSTPLPLIEKLATLSTFGILHIDAHADMRDAYKGSHFSHACILRRASELQGVQSLHLVGLRDLSFEEKHALETLEKEVYLYPASRLRKALFRGQSWQSLCSEIVGSLPPQVYISFDIDVLDLSWVPGTGTPVPGGMMWDEVLFLIELVVRSGRKVVGLDLSEIGSTELDVITGAHTLLRLCAMLLEF